MEEPLGASKVCKARGFVDDADIISIWFSSPNETTGNVLDSRVSESAEGALLARLGFADISTSSISIAGGISGRDGWLDERVINGSLLESETSGCCSTSMLFNKGSSESDIISSLTRPLDSEIPKSILSSPNCARANSAFSALVTVATEAAFCSNDWLKDTEILSAAGDGAATGPSGLVVLLTSASDDVTTSSFTSTIRVKAEAFVSVVYIKIGSRFWRCFYVLRTR